MPETTNYMILGYVVTVVILAVLVGYLILKARNLRTELRMLEELEREDEQQANVAPVMRGNPNPNTASPGHTGSR